MHGPLDVEYQTEQGYYWTAIISFMHHTFLLTVLIFLMRHVAIIKLVLTLLFSTQLLGLCHWAGYECSNMSWLTSVAISGLADWSYLMCFLSHFRCLREWFFLSPRSSTCIITVLTFHRMLHKHITSNYLMNMYSSGDAFSILGLTLEKLHVIKW